MGCDGGSIPRRDEMVKLKKKAAKADKVSELAAKWRHCSIRAEKLQQPIVACDLGRLYNKESVLMALLDKSNMPEIANHIRSLKDVVELRLTVNPSYKPSDKADAYDAKSAEYICPVTGLEMSGHHRFAYLRNCGCVLSEKALKEVPSTNCHKCGKLFNKDDVIIINGTEEEVEQLRENMEERRKAVKLNKRKRRAETIVANDTPSDVPMEVSHGHSSSTTPPDVNEATPSATPITEAAISKDEQPPREKKSKLKKDKLVPSSRPKKAATSVTQKTVSKKDYTKANGYESRDAYRKLFTSSTPTRDKDQTSHWVTYFPYH